MIDNFSCHSSSVQHVQPINKKMAKGIIMEGDSGAHHVCYISSRSSDVVFSKQSNVAIGRSAFCASYSRHHEGHRYEGHQEREEN